MCKVRHRSTALTCVILHYSTAGVFGGKLDLETLPHGQFGTILTQTVIIPAFLCNLDGQVPKSNGLQLYHFTTD